MHQGKKIVTQLLKVKFFFLNIATLHTFLFWFCLYFFSKAEYITIFHLFIVISILSGFSIIEEHWSGRHIHC